MKCAWKELLSILPEGMGKEVDELGKDTGQEIRMMLNVPARLVTGDGIVSLSHKVTYDDLLFVINAASRYSPWTARTVSKGYLTSFGGHRIGICGRAVMEKGSMVGISEPNSLCIRIARDFPGIARGIDITAGSMLILGPPGTGKTTLLRDLVRQYSCFVGVVDEKEEIFPTTKEKDLFFRGQNIHVLTGVTKAQGIDAILRNMGPKVIAVDEITAKEDCEALMDAGWCAVTLLATAHARNKQDLMKRRIYRPLAESRLFDTLIVLHEDKHWHTERMNP